MTAGGIFRGRLKVQRGHRSGDREKSCRRRGRAAACLQRFLKMGAQNRGTTVSASQRFRGRAANCPRARSSWEVIPSSGDGEVDEMPAARPPRSTAPDGFLEIDSPRTTCTVRAESSEWAARTQQSVLARQLSCQHVQLGRTCHSTSFSTKLICVRLYRSGRD